MKHIFFIFLLAFTISLAMDCQEYDYKGFGPLNSKGVVEAGFIESLRSCLPFLGKRAEEDKYYEPYSPPKPVPPLQRTCGLPPRPLLKKPKIVISEEQKYKVHEDKSFIIDPMSLFDSDKDEDEAAFLSAKSTETEVTDRRVSNLEEMDLDESCFKLSEEINPPLDENGMPIDRRERSILEARLSKGRGLKTLVVETPEFVTYKRLRDF